MKEILQNKHAFVIFLFCITLLTFARSVMVPLYILFPFFLYFIVPYRLKGNATLLILAHAILITYFLFSDNEIFLSNFFISSYIILSTLLLFLSSPIPSHVNDSNGNLIFLFIKMVTIFMIGNNLIGFFEYFTWTRLHLSGGVQDDAFVGIYGAHGVGPHGMAIINGLLFTYYFSRYKNDRRKYSLVLLTFFMICFVMSFYGLGLILMILAFLLYYLILKRSIKLTIIISVSLLIVSGFMYLVAPETLLYNYKNVDSFVLGLEEIDKNESLKGKNDILKPKEPTNIKIPRKILVFYYYYKYYIQDTEKLLAGTGPGTFNSRTSFLLNGDYSPKNPLEKVFGISEPTLAYQYIYPLWHSKQVFKKFQDGTRNQPFSSVIALLSEYGLIFCIILFLFITRKIKFIINSLEKSKNNRDIRVFKDFLLLSGLFIFLNLLADNLLEFTEMMFYIIFIKLVETYSIYLSKNDSLLNAG